MNCLRCGSKIEEGVFCTACSRTVAVPLEESPYLHTRITLPNRKAQPPVKKAEPKKERRRLPWRWIMSSVLLGLLCLALLLRLGYMTYRSMKNQQELLRLQGVEEEHVRLTDRLNELQGELAELKTQLRLPETATFEELQEVIAREQTENVDLQIKLSSLMAEQLELQLQLEELVQKAEFYDAHIAFIQESDSYYHSYDCKDFLKTGYRAYNTQQAISLGYDPCPLCQVEEPE